nr:immunoglobulin heavy chain junction region [Macaca mulatta]MOX95113.1 immunoglobulin heavy chain junction region [Macaca mulatta]MOX96613.1 immunoglobulin heavy chain junction region [Macaca mulatta]
CTKVSASYYLSHFDYW